MIQRLAAIAAAVALVAAALVVREAVIEKDDGDDGGDAQRVANVVCASELGAACVERATREDVNETFAAMASAEDQAAIATDAWLTPGPWPHMVQEARRASGSPQVEFDVVAMMETDLVAVIRNRPATCAGDVTWRCLGDAASASRATSRPALAAPSSAAATRLFARAAFVGSFLGTPQYASNDLTDDTLAWIESVERTIDAGQDRGARTLAEFLVLPAADVFITTAAEARSAGDQFDVVVPTPRAAVQAQIGYTDGEVRGLTEEFEAALRAAGWAAPASDDTGLPSPGVLLALREVGS